MSRRLDADRQLTHGLTDVCARYGVTLDRHHDALEDARATAAILPHLLAASGITDVADLDAVLRPNLGADGSRLVPRQDAAGGFGAAPSPLGGGEDLGLVAEAQ